MARSAQVGDEVFDGEGDGLPDHTAPPAPPSADDAPFAWVSPDAPGAMLPAPLELPEGGLRFVVTAAWRRRRIRNAIVNSVEQLAVSIGVLLILTAGDLSATVTILTSTWLWILPVVIAAATLAAPFVRPGPLAMTLTEDGFVYESSWFHLAAGWESVVQIVQLGADATTLALRTSAPAVTWERPGRGSWRNVPYPWETTVPLAPFTMGEPTRQVQGLVAGLLPSLAENPASVEAPRAQAPGRRAIGFGIGLTPLALIAVVFSLLIQDDPLTLVVRSVVICGLGAVSLAGWNGRTAERTVDYVARVALGPAKEPRRTVAAVLAPVYAAYLFFLPLGFLLSSGSSPAADPVAKYGPAHTCWVTDAGEISGCRLGDGRLAGTVTKTQVTCYFSEPIPREQKTVHCP